MGQFIPNFEYFWPPAQGLTGWTIAFYGAGLDPIPANLKTVYADQAQTTPIANPVELDIEGKCSVVLGAGGYKIVVRDDEDVVQDTKDNVSNSAGSGPGSETAFVETIEDLRNWTTFSGSVYVAGYYAAGDGGEGTFYWDSTVLTPDDGGYIIAPVSSPVAGRWLRIPDEAQVVRSASFGAIGTSSNRTAQMVNANQYAAVNDLQLLVNVPVTVGTISFTAPLVKVSEGAFLRGPSGTSTYTFQGIFEADYSYVFDNSVGTVNVVFSSRQVSNPYWFGGSPSAEGSTNTPAFVRWKAAGGGFMVLPPGSWKHTGSFTPSASIPTRFDGKITLPNSPYSVTTNTGAYYPDEESKWHIGLVEFPNNQTLSAYGPYGILALTDFHVGRNANVGQNLDVQAAINAGGSITSQQNVVGEDGIFTNTLQTSVGPIVAGNGATGTEAFVRVRAGTGAQNFKAGGQPLVTIGSGNLSLPENSLIATNDSLEVYASGTASAGSGTLTVQIRFGSQSALSISLATDCTLWFAKVHVFRTGATTGFASGFITTNAIAPASQAQADIRSSVSITWANANTISTNLSGVALAQSMLTARIFPI